MWRGVVYSILMVVSKLLCGLWLVRFPLSAPGEAWKRVSSPVLARYRAVLAGVRTCWSGRSTKPDASAETPEPAGGRRPAAQNTATAATTTASPEPPAKPLSLYPAGVIGWAMVARGEIGFLISAVAESKGIFRGSDAPESAQDASSSSELFLLVTWAVVLCTVVGPICVGLLVRRIKRLEELRVGTSTSTSVSAGVAGAAAGAGRGSRDVLGVWGLN